MSRTSTAATAMMAFLLSGCAGYQQHEKELSVSSVELKQYTDGKPEPLQRLYARLPKEGKRNEVLNNNRIGVAAFELGEDDLAAKALDDSISKIESIYADNSNAEKAKSLFYKENAKDYKGDAYERAMTFYYRGLVYLRAGDFENARASFKAGMLQDSFAEQQRYRADFASLAFLEGWTSQCLGDHAQAKERFTEATELNNDLHAPDGQDNLLVIYETGKAPIKVPKGKYNEAVSYIRMEGPARTDLKVFINGDQKPLTAAEDIYWQASTRGGREIDTILAGKANFKDGAKTTAAVGAATAVAAAEVSNQQQMMGNYDSANTAAIAGLIGEVVALGAIVADSASRAEADVRYWDNLPSFVYLSTLTSKNQADKSVLIDSELKPNEPRTLLVSWRNGCGFAWGRNASALKIPDSAPGAIANPTTTASPTQTLIPPSVINKTTLTDQDTQKIASNHAIKE